MTVATFAMSAGTSFTWHTHEDHQLAWASRGVLTVVTDVATWVLPPTRALFIPQGLEHETLASGQATMRTLYIRPQSCPIRWLDPTPVAVSPLLVELIGHLDQKVLDGSRRERAEAVLVDLLEPVVLATIEVRTPRDERAREVAQLLGDNPCDKRTIDEWGRAVGASGRTLARAFLADTGVTFGRWRSLARLQAALPALAGGEAVGKVARRVGYDSTSAFVAAFRRETGMTPAAFVEAPHRD
ncbi:MAG: helix-turn-helix transcriptional regulator [Acidimicrobiales bacterium]|jgi:AraC-like DNA-binding protein